MLQCFEMTNAKSANTPMEVNLRLEKGRQGVNQALYPYQQIIGRLLYLSVCSRPEIAYVMS